MICLDPKNFTSACVWFGSVLCKWVKRKLTFLCLNLLAKEQSLQRYVLTSSNFLPLCTDRTNSEFALIAKCEHGSYGAKKTEFPSYHLNYSTRIRDVDVSSVYKCLRLYVLVLWVDRFVIGSSSQHEIQWRKIGAFRPITTPWRFQTWCWFRNIDRHCFCVACYYVTCLLVSST